MSTLKAPVYLLDQNSELFKLYKDANEAEKNVQPVFKEIEAIYPLLSPGVLGVWTGDYMGIEIGSEAEQFYNNELTKKEKGGFRPFRKNSKMLRQIIAISNGAFEKMSQTSCDFSFEKLTHFGMNAISGTHLVNGKLYLSFRFEPERNLDELKEVSYPQYLKEFAESMEAKEGSQ